jgi:YidC/Oxa1 family membrane protein insertase
MNLNDHSRLFLAAVLMIGVLLVSWFISGKGSQQQPVVDTVSTINEENVRDADADETTAQVIDTPLNASENPNYTERNVTIIIPAEDSSDTLVVAQITTTGGAISAWQLPNYNDYYNQESDQYVDLAINNWMISRSADSTQVLFEYTGPDTIIAGESGSEVRLVCGTAVKTYTFTKGFYEFGLETIGLEETATIASGAIPFTESQASSSGYFSASWFTNGHKSKKADDMETLEGTGNVAWIASCSKYFAIIMFPESTERTNGYIEPGNGGSPSVSLDDTRITVYAGPKAYPLLSKLGRSTTDMIDFGWPIIRLIGKLIYLFLSSVLSFVSNWGVRIILLAFALKLVMSPLTTKSYESMQKMQQIQPAMKEIQNKYSKDLKQQQTEMQKLYKERGVNPLGGCLPMLLQMPVFLAMYRVLDNMVELRGAKFILWITDLSRTEILIPFGTKIFGLEGIGLMAVLLGLIMFMQQKLTGTTSTGSSAQQQKMMLYMMPIVMTFLFIKFASGLTLYWLVFNILTLIDQEFIKKRLGDKLINGNSK